MTTPRQRLSTQTHLSDDLAPFLPHVKPATDDQGIAVVSIIDGLAVQAADPSVFHRLAAACLEAAQSLESLQLPVAS